MNQDIRFTKCEDVPGGMNFSQERLELEVTAKEFAMKRQNVSLSNGGANQIHIPLWVPIIVKYHHLVNTMFPFQPDLRTKVFCI